MDGRTKRAIKTPKRFDDEAFGPSSRGQTSASKVTPEAPKASPEISTPSAKNILKVKLNKAKPRELFKPPAKEQSAKVAEPPKDTPKSKDTPKAKDIQKAAKESSVVIKKEPRESSPETKETTVGSTDSADASFNTTSVPSATASPVLSIKKEPRETSLKSREVTVKKERESRETKPKEPPKHREVSKLREIPKIDIKTPERESTQLVYRPKTKRPRTPPNYHDLIPNVILPFWDARTAADEHEDDNVKELVHCQCGIGEELGLMVQCETCLTWQHAHCLGVDKPEDVPESYTCRACLDPKFVRDSMKWAYDQDWLTQGKMKKFLCDTTPAPEKSVSVLHKINQLIGDVLKIHQIIHSLRVKQRILMNANDDDPELKLFKNCWSASYVYRDGTPFVPTISLPPGTPASTISAMAETPDLNDLNVDAVAGVTLPELGQLEDVILDAPDVPSPPPLSQLASTEVTPNDCRSNLKLHIQQTEEFISIELAQIEEHLVALEQECHSTRNSSNPETSIELLKNDLHTMRKYISLTF